MSEQILDSGSRREYKSGAVRDVSEGKGRCDLLPLDVVSQIIGDPIFTSIDLYVRGGDTGDLVGAIALFLQAQGKDEPTSILEVSQHYEAGCHKYGDRNWEKGIPLHCYIDSGVRHYLKHLRGDKDEAHDRAFIWNLMCCIYTHNHLPEMIDLPFRAGGGT